MHWQAGSYTIMMKRYFSYLFLLVQIIGFSHCSLAAVVKAIDHTDYQRQLQIGDDDRRSCEILASKQFLPPLTFTIFVQAGARCPDEFHDLTDDDIKEVLGDDIQRVQYNGFRKVIFDDNLYEDDTGAALGPGNLQFITFGPNNIPFFNMGEIVITGVSPLYEESRVERKVVPVWKAGKPVYELVAPNCSALYVLQTMWIGGRGGVWGAKNESELATLELDLPEGWIYQSRVLTEDVVVPLVNGTAVVLTDSAKNAYSKVDIFDPAIVCPDNDGENNINNVDDETQGPTSSPIETPAPTSTPIETFTPTSSQTINSNMPTPDSGASLSAPLIVLFSLMLVVAMAQSL